MEAGAFSPVHISWAEALLRIALSMLLPLLIGLDRFLRRKPIDFRPFVIVALAACSLSLGIMELGSLDLGRDLDIGPSRIFAGVITGIGFLGAGAMFREENYVKGTGSAASIWAAGAIGLLCGVGLLWLAGVLAGGVLLVLVASAPFTDKYDPD